MNDPDTDRWFPNGAASRAVLIGTSRFTSPELENFPSVAGNLQALWTALTHRTQGLLAPEHCRVVADPADPAAVGAALAWAAREAEELLLVYYAGHGVLDDTTGVLHLGLTHTDRDHLGFSAVPIDLVRRHVGEARARARVLVLDCCFSGRAISAMTGPTDLALGQLDLAGTYTLTSTTRNRPSLAPPGEPYTAFTGALLDALAVPVPLTLDEIHAQVDRTLLARGLPRPQRRSAGAGGSLVLMRGPSGVAGSNGSVRPPGPTGPTPHAYGANGAPPPPSFGPGWTVPPPPPPRPARRTARPVLIAAAVAGALTVFLTSSMIRGLFGDDDGHTGNPAGRGTVSTGTTPGNPGTGEATPPGTAGGPSRSDTPSPSTAKVIYRDRRLTLRAATCLGTAVQALDLDAPSSGPAPLGRSDDADLLYIGCGNLYAAKANLVRNDSVQVGRADAGTVTAEACRAAAQGNPVGPHPDASKITAGTVWCVVTNRNRVAKVTFAKVDTADDGSGASADGPTFELTATLWDAPATS
ncbi:caspase family protein (plasmid) [Streptomyces sp. BHT-5-2]|uniref:caspase family protein n=1 Tax=Streptomyces sp. BHT-5-2 TaxID=2866715 RepID=UPI001C8D2753|nr:caspase family protein [Streptomyces sp. BHT-5-2]QZL07158.1 caspase family protein [Streptomyces sp. BHT-5-2]